MIKLTWLSHASWLIETKSQRILLDPFFTDNPAAKVTADDFGDVTHVLVSHGHFDHTSDVAAVIAKSGAQLIAIFELAQWFNQHHGIQDPVGMNIGGTFKMPDGSVQMVPAIHSSSLPDGSYAGEAAGFMLDTGDRRIYFACDTALFGDMKLYAGGCDVAVLPVGDLYTMGMHDSIEAIKLIEPKVALPSHYNTWPPIEQDAAHWATMVRSETDTRPVVLDVGQTYEV